MVRVLEDLTVEEDDDEDDEEDEEDPPKVRC